MAIAVTTGRIMTLEGQRKAMANLEARAVVNPRSQRMQQGVCCRLAGISPSQRG
jgi:hypothetical protein